MTPRLPDPATSEEVTPQDVAAWLTAENPGQSPVVVDCREAEEIDICRIDGSHWLPMADFPEAVAKLHEHADRGIVVTCHHGVRSLRAARFLRHHGIARAFSMAGGIDAWSRLIDPEVPRY